MPPVAPDLADIKHSVSSALREDIGAGDITAELIAANEMSSAWVTTREDAVLCGTPWVDEVFAQLDDSVALEWHCHDGQSISAGDTLLTLRGNTRSILTGERTALNYLQLLSGTATIAARYAAIVADTAVSVLDTRKTIPGLRTAQKYAVACGGCVNHRIGLFDAYLIKENHIAGCGSVAAAVAAARSSGNKKTVEVEVETLAELAEALEAGADIIMLDNFSLADMRSGVKICAGRARLEASGNVTLDTLGAIAATGVDYISIGALTKDCRAIDLSLRLDHHAT